jgi:hypothetical protein
LEAGADPNTFKTYHVSNEYGRRPFFSFPPFSTNPTGHYDDVKMTALHVACKEVQDLEVSLELVKILLQFGAKINERMSFMKEIRVGTLFYFLDLYLFASLPHCFLSFFNFFIFPTCLFSSSPTNSTQHLPPEMILEVEIMSQVSSTIAAPKPPSTSPSKRSLATSSTYWSWQVRTRTSLSLKRLLDMEVAIVHQF